MSNVALGELHPMGWDRGWPSLLTPSEARAELHWLQGRPQRDLKTNMTQKTPA